MTRARKRFGQHFLRDNNVIQRIIAALAPQPGQLLVEIGPGLGALTKPLLQAAGQVQAIELDRDLVPKLLQHCHSSGDLRVHCEDALRFDFRDLAPTGRSLRIVGNLPYNISTALLFHLLSQADCIRDMHLMLQKEVVARMAAMPGSGDYGRLSVMVQYACRVEPLFQVAADAFNPPPQVESAVVRLLPYAQPSVQLDNEADFGELVRQAFSQRRKTLRNSLRTFLSAAEIAQAGIDPGTRPERLELEQFATLSNCLSSKKHANANSPDTSTSPHESSY